jgi:glycosyltransferase involved in cell wall biosynthesis
MNVDTSIIIVPRERLTSVLSSLQSLFKTIPEEIPVIVVEGCSPPEIRQGLKKLQGERKFECISLEYFVTPHEARNIGMGNVDTEYVVFSDNDIFYEPDWLSHLKNNARSYGSDLVAPLICIGPPLAKKLHHAGGRLVIQDSGGRPLVSELHRLANKPIEIMTTEKLSVDIDIVEFHCFLARSDYIRKVGPLDERLITREQIDFGLRAAINNANVTFEQRSVVTFAGYMKILPIDLTYFIFRWSDPFAQKSILTLMKTWDIQINVNKVINDWILRHRFHAVASAFPKRLEMLGRKKFIEQVYIPLDKGLTMMAMATRKHLGKPAYPADPDSIKKEMFFAERMQIMHTNTLQS